ncbi:30S ribosomal protein S12 methylthiotransferase RimO [Bdellovibrionota bacterium FG-2]
MTAKSPVYFVSLGCPKNLVDSQVMLGILAKDRYSITQDPAEAEVIIVNTCSFVDASKEESIETILEMADYKTTGACKVLVTAGCLPQRYSAQLEKEMPEVDLFIGTGQYHRITEILNDRTRVRKEGDPLPKRTYVGQPAFIHSEKDPRVQTGPSYTAFLKISEGCNRRCSFCIIPTLRGNVRSRGIASLVEEAAHLAKSGVRELNLVAQDLTEYGMEGRYQERLELLLPELCKIEGLEWIRLHYVYPDEFSDELIEIFAREPKIVKYLDMPIQHTNDRVLKLMNRRLTKKRLFEVVEKLRARVPELVLRTSIIVGFPSETEREFEELCDDLTTLNLDRVGVFRYSQEEGTKAAEMSEQVHSATKWKREKRLTQLFQDRSLAKQKQYLKARLKVLLEGQSEETDLLLQGRFFGQAQEIDGHVLINDVGDCDTAQLRAGTFVEVEITEALPHDLIGRFIKVLADATA